MRKEFFFFIFQILMNVNLVLVTLILVVRTLMVLISAHALKDLVEMDGFAKVYNYGWHLAIISQFNFFAQNFQISMNVI